MYKYSIFWSGLLKHNHAQLNCFWLYSNRMVKAPYTIQWLKNHVKDIVIVKYDYFIIT